MIMILQQSNNSWSNKSKKSQRCRKLALKNYAN